MTKSIKLTISLQIINGLTSPWLLLPIMKYMGDYPSKRFRQSTDLTDAIFEPALLHVSLYVFQVNVQVDWTRLDWLSDL